VGVAIFEAIEKSLQLSWTWGTLSLWLFEMEMNFACEKQLSGRCRSRIYVLFGIVVVVSGV